jgi:hypothetical protein
MVQEFRRQLCNLPLNLFQKIAFKRVVWFGSITSHTCNDQNRKSRSARTNYETIAVIVSAPIKHSDKTGF